jgi:putative ABC transport system substrate-binding protein
MIRLHVACGLVILTVCLTTGSADTCAEQPPRIAIVGRLAVTGGPNDPVNEAIRRGLRELGYAEGRDFRLETRTANGQIDQLLGSAEELVRLNADVIVTGTDLSARTAKQATNTIPIVAIIPDGDPVTSGLIESFNRPGGNITGLTVRNSQLASKRLELLKEIVPGLTRVAVLWDTLVRPEVNELEQSARLLGIKLQLIEVKAPYDFEGAFRAAKRNKAGAVMLLSSPHVYIRRFHLGAQARENHLPADAPFRDFTEAGGLMSYSTDVMDAFHRAAYFIDRILKGAQPGDLPFEQSETIKISINLKTAKALGITIPESILLRADEVIR